MPRYHKETRDILMNETRLGLLSAATESLARDGFDKANVNLIAKDAGYSIGTFYNYFPSKRQLLYALIDEISREHIDYVSQAVEKETDPEKMLTIFFEAGFDFVGEYLSKAKAIFNTLNGPDGEFKEYLFRAYQPLFDLLSEQILAKGIEQGIFREVDVLATTNLLMFIYLGVGSQVNQQGELWVNAAQVSSFVLNSLVVTGQG